MDVLQWRVGRGGSASVGGARGVEGAGAIIEASGIFTMSRQTTSQFFLASTRSVAAAANHLGVPHVLLSIVNCESPQVRGYGYFAAKAEQEDFARERSDRLILVRITQWFEFAEQNLERVRFGPERMTLWQMTRSLKRRGRHRCRWQFRQAMAAHSAGESAFLGTTPKSSAPGSTTGSALAREGDQVRTPGGTDSGGE